MYFNTCQKHYLLNYTTISVKINNYYSNQKGDFAYLYSVKFISRRKNNE